MSGVICFLDEVDDLQHLEADLVDQGLGVLGQQHYLLHRQRYY